MTTTDRLPDVWVSRDYPVLREAVRMIDQGRSMPGVNELATATGLGPEQVRLAVAALERRGLVEAFHTLGGVVSISSVAGEACFTTGLHPEGDDMVSQLMSALRQAAERSPDASEKTRLRKLADAAGDVTRDVLAGVLISLASGQIAR